MTTGMTMDAFPVGDALGISRADALLADHLNAAVSRFGPDALGVIDLPPLDVTSSVVPAQVNAAATVLWAMELDATGLLEFVDALAEGMIHGTLLLPIAEAGRALMKYQREKHDRFSAAERQALYDRIFDDEVRAKLDHLAVTLSNIGRAGPQESISALRAKASTIATDLGNILSERSVGITAFAARSIIAHVKKAIALLKDPELSRALGGQSLWQTLRNMAPVFLQKQVDPSTHIALARSGMAMLDWVGGGAPPVDRNSGVVVVAEEWRTVKGLS